MDVDRRYDDGKDKDIEARKEKVDEEGSKESTPSVQPKKVPISLEELIAKREEEKREAEKVCRTSCSYLFLGVFGST